MGRIGKKTAPSRAEKKAKPVKVAAVKGSVRTGLSVAAIKAAFLENLTCILGKFPEVATPNEHYLALAYTVRDRLLDRWARTAHTYYDRASRTVCYLSAEFLLGPHLGNNLANLGIEEEVCQAMQELGVDLDALKEREEEPGLGNGGLGRLAACYMDSLATLGIPALGYGIRYEFGIFDQAIHDGWQVETTDKWLRFGNPWEIPRPEIAFDVKLGGCTEGYHDNTGVWRVRWVPHQVVKGVAYDTAILGYRTGTANLLRLFKAEAPESFDFGAFNTGDYLGAVYEKMTSENITKVLYPNDESASGKELRLEQQYFFVSCALRDMIRIYLQREKDMTRFHLKYAVQLNDTHPSIAVAELMRLLVDEYLMAWEPAWEITRQTFAYTNHTLMPEALEKWPVDLFGRILPRHIEIIYEINRRFLDEVRTGHPGDEELVRQVSLIDETGPRFVRMANLACVGSHAINGVARLHSELLKKNVLGPFCRLWPEKFSNKTNGVTPRRFMVVANPGLTKLISEHIGEDWIRDLDQLRRLEPLAGRASFQKAWREVKRANKAALAWLIRERTGMTVDPDTLFDIQVKRIHEYKRQHLNILHAIVLYQRLKRDPGRQQPARTVIFGGKAAPGYRMAKLIIRLIHGVAGVVNNDPATRDRLRVAFVPDFNVKTAHWVYPAADLSEQISTAGLEASGTGNMKFAMNGALTIGTLDGANVEIREEAGGENFFLFGLAADQVAARKREGYHPRPVIEREPELRAALEAIADGVFSGGDHEMFGPLLDNLWEHDPFLVCADFAAYAACQERVGAAFADTAAWARMSIFNTARMGKFSSDRAIREYCRDIWKVEPVEVHP
ncbi:MAG: glycogen/starch/alpha-glucan phosphorylase [Planctomycetota bacterium]